jgi:hypothetical protein
MVLDLCRHPIDHAYKSPQLSTFNMGMHLTLFIFFFGKFGRGNLSYYVIDVID